MPESYRPRIRRDEEKKRTLSQTVETNMATDNSTVGEIVDYKGKKLISIRPEDTLGTAVEVLRDENIGALVVTDAEGVLRGILSERDIVRKLAETPGRTLPHRVEEVMTANVQTCTADEPLVSVLRRMTKGRFRHMPIMESTGPVGMVTIGDVVNHRLVQLEQEALQLKQLIVG